MAHTNGITITTINDSNVAIIDLDKYGDELRSFLEKNGITTKTEEDAFEKKWKTGIPLNKAFGMVHEHIDTLKWKK